ncbi:hypothetical protein LTR10_014167 [Elasticomyces elasticus]|uniref:Nephrocystin 3-like N-terminal domain-containing protein n=1 Tax=Exophiala sideris TaxID=1016849 RepID=A0ABR0J3S7_9EURO|nr:hypothetical protein LTR10_014167 [Elasticomyces elasticus]KAK5026575.1 hypothetical protein LTS07_007509 [Exophiala sideris]KAK5033685.1 hypothetical protein LTR13_006737 [Exophiala sideris]KAK5055508.1 hypothetical protein LTR69_008341 [Exophiala sideris]KAK5180110.1 hypothetical protein LTR44_007586 [Eurotiomycetes sp. CCFEE 6388]
MWLRDQLPSDFPSIRVLIYGYDTKLLKSESFQTVDDLAVSLIAQLRSIGKTQTFTKPLLIVAHSLGGLLVKRALCLLAGCGDSEAFMLDRVRLVVMFGVPSAGMRMEYLLPMVDGQPNQYLVECLSPDDPHNFVRTLNDSFYGISHLRRIRLISAYETQRTRTAKETSPGVWGRVGDPVTLVPPSSAIQKGSRNPSDVFPVDHDHSSMVKFTEDDVHYVTLQRFLREVLDSAQRSDFMGTIPPNNLAATDSPFSRYGDGEGTAIGEGGLKSLWFSEIDYREEHIAIAHDHSYEWLHDPNLRFFEWLQSTSRLYWIRGKPGSGKSTLMKYLRKAMSLWEGSTGHGSTLDKQFEFLWFFFNARGSYKQKSFEGLLRSILLQLGSRYPVVAQVIEERHRAKQTSIKDVWTDDELLSLFEHVKCEAKFDRQIVLFLDALDEFNGYPEIIAEFLSRLSDSPNETASLDIRICFSSRPWDAFVERFDTCTGFKLQEWTRSDISRYTKSRLEVMLQSQEPPLGSGALRHIERDVADYIRIHAQGVFLWVTMVLDELERMALSCTSPTLFYTQLIKLPTELEDYYGLIIGRIPPIMQLEALILLELVLRDLESPTDPSLLFLASRCARGETLEACQRLWRSAETDMFDGESLDLHLKDLCGGMLEIVDSGRGAIVQFMHETARDFVDRPDFRQRIFPGKALSLQRMDGHVMWTKYWFTYHGFNGPLDSHVDDVVTENVRQLCQYAYSAEQRTGEHLANFLDSVPRRLFSDSVKGSFRKAYWIHSPLSFAVLAGLELYVLQSLSIAATEGPQGCANLLNGNTDEALAHGLCHEVHERSRRREDEPSLGRMTKLLVDNGLDVNTHVNGYLPIELLFLDVTPYEFLHDKTTDGFVEVLNILLEAGCDPNTRLFYDNTGLSHPTFWKGRFQRRAAQCRLLHVSSVNLSLSLLKYGADANAYDSYGHTPLDVCLYIDVKRIAGDRTPSQALETVTILMKAGAHLSQDGYRYLKTLSKTLSPRRMVGNRQAYEGTTAAMHPKVLELIKTAPVLQNRRPESN